jgi:predicted nucleotidyltransferase
MSRRLYKASLTLGVVRRWPSSDARNWARSNFSCLASEPDTAAILVIGSAVRPAYHSGSDVDFLVVADGEATSDRPRPIDVDLLMFRRCEIDQKIREGDDLLGWAIRFGRAIFDRDQFWANLRSRWSHQLPFPSPEVSIARALRFECIARELVAMGDFDAALEQIIAVLTHRARASLLRAHVYPASRPELPMQLHKIGQQRLAESLECALRRRFPADVLDELTCRTSDSPDRNRLARMQSGGCGLSIPRTL